MSLFILDAIGLDVLTMVKPVSAVPGSTQKAKVPPEGEAKCLKRLVGRVGIEPTSRDSRAHNCVANRGLVETASEAMMNRRGQ
jgi:hypothetical protein